MLFDVLLSFGRHIHFSDSSRRMALSRDVCATERIVGLRSAAARPLSELHALEEL